MSPSMRSTAVDPHSSRSGRQKLFAASIQALEVRSERRKPQLWRLLEETVKGVSEFISSSLRCLLRHAQS